MSHFGSPRNSPPTPGRRGGKFTARWLGKTLTGLRLGPLCVSRPRALIPCDGHKQSLLPERRRSAVFSSHYARSGGCASVKLGYRSGALDLPLLPETPMKRPARKTSDIALRPALASRREISHRRPLICAVGIMASLASAGA